MSEEQNEFETLCSLNVNDKTEKKNNLTYLSWAWAWQTFVKVYPQAKYEVVKNENMMPYFKDESGAFCYTRVTAGGITHEMWLPVMDGANNAMKDKPYTYNVKEYAWDNSKRKSVPTGNMIEKTVEAYTTFDINKTVMRCLTKNLAMFGLGLYIYAGEDLPEGEEAPQKAPAPSKASESDVAKAMNEFKNKLESFNIDPRKFLERDGVNMSDTKQVYATVRKYLGLSPEMFIGVLENWEE